MTEFEILSMYRPETIGIFLMDGVSRRDRDRRQKLIRSMEDRGLLRWLPDPFGGWQIQWAITDKGREYLAALPREEGE